MLALVFSDLHLHLWEQFSKRFDAQLKVFEYLVKLADRNKCPILFSGDLFHTPKDIKNSLLGILIPFLKTTFKQYPNVKIYAISGNHDQATENYIDKPSPSYIKTLSLIIPNIICIDYKSVRIKDYVVYGIPYMTHNIGLEVEVKRITKIMDPKLHNILLTHTDFKGQKDTNGVIVGQGKNFKEEIFNPFYAVFNGHIHKRGKLRDNIYSVGAPLQLRLSDKDSIFGFWMITKKDIRFRKIDFTPKYRLYKDISEINNDTDIWVKIPKQLEEMGFSETLNFSNKELLEQYFKDQNIRSKSIRVKLRKILNQIW